MMDRLPRPQRTKCLNASTKYPVKNELCLDFAFTFFIMKAILKPAISATIDFIAPSVILPYSPGSPPYTAPFLYSAPAPADLCATQPISWDCLLEALQSSVQEPFSCKLSLDTVVSF